MEYLAYIAILLLLGTFASVLARRLNISNLFFLIFIGMLLGAFKLVTFSNDIIVVLSFLVLIMIIFDGASKLKLRELVRYSRDSLRLAFVFFVFNVGLLSLIIYLWSGIGYVLCLLFGVLMYGIDPGVVLSVLKGKKNKVIEILEIESLINTPVTIIGSLTILDFFSRTGAHGFFSSIVSYAVPLFQQVVVGAFIGFVLGYIITRLMKSVSFGDLSPLALIASSIISYVVSESLGGSGVLSVAVFAIVFGNLHIEHRVELGKFASVFTNTLKILVFILIGTIIVIDPGYVVPGTFLFLIYLMIRAFSVLIALPHLPKKDILFLTINVPKGIDVAVLLLIITTSYMSLPGIGVVKNLSFVFVLYSILLSTVSSHLGGWLKTKAQKESAKTG